VKKEDAKLKYEELFPDVQSKASAFDKLAEMYYFSNFGSAGKSEIDLLMFSLYLEQILDKDQNDLNAYSDYTLSKQLGITQSRISNLKIKKELVYPYKDFDWKESFLSVSNRIVAEENRIKLFLPDPNLYVEVKNAVEAAGGFIDVTLTRNLLVIKTEYFLDLMIAVSDDKDKDRIKKEIAEKLAKNKDVDLTGKDTFGAALKKHGTDMIIEIIGECIPVFGGAVKVFAKHVWDAVKETQ